MLSTSWETTQNHSFVISRWKSKAVSCYVVLWITGITCGYDSGIPWLTFQFWQIWFKEAFCINVSQFQTQTFGFLRVGEFLTFILFLRIVDSQARQTLLRVLRTLGFPGLNFGKLSTVMIFFPWILRLLYSSSAVEHDKLLSYDLCFPLSCRYFGFKNSLVKIKLS